MNEQELKQIWRTEEAIPLKNIDMEFIQQYTSDTNNILRQLSRKELTVVFFFSVIFVFDFFYSGNFYVVLAAVAVVWAFLIWKNRRDEKLDDSRRAENVKNFLVEKEKSIKRQIKMQRVFNAVSIFFFVPLIGLLNGSFYTRIENPWRYLISSTITYIVVQFGFEFYNRQKYNPILEDLRYLIEQFDEDENRR